MARTVHCIKLGRDAEGLDQAPFPGELGERIFDNVSRQAWAMWVEHQKMLINEKRLSMADAKARRYLNEQLQLYFFGAGADQAAGYVPPKT